MIKRKYMIIALAIVSVLVGSLLYSNLVSGASSSSGSWGAIRFVEPSESTENQGVWKDAATFTWIPNNSTDNAIVSIVYYLELKSNVSALNTDTRVKVVGSDYGDWSSPFMRWTPTTNYAWYSEAAEHSQYAGIRPPPNQGNYTIILQFRAKSSAYTAYVRNINIIVTVADGMVPNEYYKVELPSAGVGGLYIPVDKFSLLAPYIALVSTIILAVSISVAYIKYRKKQ